jgi:hypothetical protein
MPLRSSTPWEQKTNLRQTILLDPDTWTALHALSAAKDMSLSAVVRAGLRTLIKQEQAAKGLSQ